LSPVSKAGLRFLISGGSCGESMVSDLDEFHD
jgi:hypothetical protein